jgi:hypothetical protein
MAESQSVRRPRTDGGETDGDDAATDTDQDDEEWVPLEGLSQEGLLLLFAGLAAGMASLTALSRGQPQPVVVFGAAAGVVAIALFAVDLLSGYAPDLWAHLLVGGGALLAAGFAVPGRHYVNAATFGVAAALVLWRVVDVEILGADR